MKANKELDLFIKTSKLLGEDFNLVQGAGGNTSFKYKDSLFIKASGCKLNASTKKNIFVELNLKKLIINIKNESIDPLKGAWDKSKDLKPSIETTMHAIIPYKYVFHLHCLNTISLLVQASLKKKLQQNFSNLNYSIIKYAMPGISLTKEIKNTIKNTSPNILFLSNHGLVVSGNEIKDTLNNVYYISNTLKKLTKEKTIFNIDKLNIICEKTKYRPTKYPEAHKIAFSDSKIKIATSGSLFPDQVLFLGPRIFIIKNKNQLLKISEDSKNNLPLLIAPNAGLLVPKCISPESEELSLALSLIISKIPQGEIINYLSNAQEKEIINSKEEQYRFQINNT